MASMKKREYVRLCLLKRKERIKANLRWVEAWNSHDRQISLGDCPWYSILPEPVFIRKFVAHKSNPYARRSDWLLRPRRLARYRQEEAMFRSGRMEA